VNSFTLAAFLHGDLHFGTATRQYRKLW